MNKNKEKVPKIRFPGFTEPWEQRKWIDVVNISTEMVNPTCGEFDDMPHIAPGNIESFTGRILDNVKTVKEEQLISGKFRFRPNDVVYGKINPQLGKYFYASKDGLTSADAYVFNGKNGLTQKFLFAMLQTESFFKYSVSVSMQSGMPKINRDELNAFSFLVPTIEEQEKIGGFLLDLDNLITLHQRKLNHLKDKKKGLLQKMFPKKGELVPELRFPEFTDPWEQRKLGDITTYYNGGSFENDVQENGQYELVTLKSINMEGKLVHSNRYVDVEEPTLAKGTLVMILSEQSPGLLGMTAQIPIDNTYILNQRVAEIRPYSSINSYFLSMAINKNQRYFSKCGAGTKVQNISKPNVENFEFLCPILQEQEKLGEFFKDFDNLITLHQRKLDHLKEQKKALLQQMFI